MQKTFSILIILIVLMLFAGFLSQIRQQRNVLPDHQPIMGGAISIEGTFICLPHRDTEGPQTMECAFGLAGDDGNNYSLDLNTIGIDAMSDIGMGERVRVAGYATPIEALSTDMWWKYDTVGIITVESVTEI